MKKIGIAIPIVFIIFIFFTITIYASQLQRIEQEKENERIQLAFAAYNKQRQDYETTFTEIIKKEQKNGFEQKYGKIISLDIKFENLYRIIADRPATDFSHSYSRTGIDIVLVYRTDKFEPRPLTQKEISSGKFISDGGREEAALFSKKIIQDIIGNLMTNNIDPQTRKINITASIKAIISEKTATGKDIIRNVITFEYNPYQDRIVRKGY